MTEQLPEISVVIPVYRNADMLAELHRRLRDVFQSMRLSFEVLFVEDACPAGSLAVLEALVQEDPRVAVLALERNVGQHRAVLAGLAQARGRCVLVMDADLQDPPEAIPILLTEMRAGWAAVFAGRRGHYESTSRLLTSRLFKGLLHMLCGLPSDAGIFVAMSQEMVSRLLAFGDSRPFVPAMIGCAGLPLASVPVIRAPRPGGGSGYSFWGRLRVARRAIGLVLARKWLRRREPPDGADTVAVRAYLGARFTGRN